jgi:hypothetical protein
LLFTAWFSQSVANSMKPEQEPMNTPDQLDRKRIEHLAYEILLPIRDNYLAGPTSRDRVFEALWL